MVWFWGGLFWALGVLDTVATLHWYKRIGSTSVELNPIIRKCMDFFGPVRGQIFGKLIPDAAAVILLGILGFNGFLGFACGVRLMWLSQQLAALRMHKDNPELQKHLEQALESLKARQKGDSN